MEDEEVAGAGGEVEQEQEREREGEQEVITTTAGNDVRNLLGEEGPRKAERNETRYMLLDELTGYEALHPLAHQLDSLHCYRSRIIRMGPGVGMGARAWLLNHELDRHIE